MLRLSSILSGVAFKIAAIREGDIEKINSLMIDYLLKNKESAFNELYAKFKPLFDSKISSYMRMYSIDISHRSDFVQKTYEVLNRVLEDNMRDVLQKKKNPDDRVKIFIHLLSKNLITLQRLAEQISKGLGEVADWQAITYEPTGKEDRMRNVKKVRELKQVIEDADVVKPRILDREILDVIYDVVEQLDPIEAYYWYRKLDLTKVDPKIIDDLGKSMKVSPEKLMKNLKEQKMRKVNDEDIANELGISKSYISGIANRSREKILKMPEIKELVAKKKISASIFVDDVLEDKTEDLKEQKDLDSYLKKYKL